MVEPSSIALDALRRGLALRLDARGQFFFEGDPVTHPRVVAVLRAGLDVAETGEPIVRVGEQWAYVTVDDTPLRVTAVVRDDDEGMWCSLDDGRRVRLDASTLIESGRGLSCEVPSQPTGRTMAARWTNAAQMQLSEWLTWSTLESRPRLHVEGRSIIIPATHESSGP